jgi:hypothetical protein
MRTTLPRGFAQYGSGAEWHLSAQHDRAPADFRSAVDIMIRFAKEGRLLACVIAMKRTATPFAQPQGVPPEFPDGLGVRRQCHTKGTTDIVSSRALSVTRCWSSYGNLGGGAFENDHASDWSAALMDASDFAAIEEAIERALESQPGRSIDLDDAIEAVAAAEIIASARGQQGASLPSKITQWLAENDYEPTEDLAARAAQAVERISQESELREEWEAKSSWVKEMSGLAKRLRAATARKRSQATETDAAFSRGSRSLVAIRKKLGFRIAWNELNENCEPTSAAAAVTLKDADLMLLGQIPSLKTLILAEGKFTLAGLQHLAGLKLDRLNLEATNISDDAAPIVTQMRGLKRLEVQETKVTDRFLHQLSELSTLEFLNVSQTRVTAHGVSGLKAALPGCTVQTESE